MSTTRLPLGQLLRDHERVGLRFERDFRHSPERVWRAITDSHDLRHWLPCDIVGPRRAGAEIEARFWPAVVEKFPDLIEQPGLPGRILTWEPPTLFEWQWDTDHLRFELTPTATGTHLVFTTWIGATPGVEQTAAGYHVCFDQLVGVVDEGRGGSVTDHDPTELEAVYRTEFERCARPAPPTVDRPATPDRPCDHGAGSDRRRDRTLRARPPERPPSGSTSLHGSNERAWVAMMRDMISMSWLPYMASPCQ